MTRERKSRITRAQRDYFLWLCDKIDRRGTDPLFRELASDLHQRAFYSKLPNDDNRVEDGKKLRDCFGMETGFEEVDLLYAGKDPNSCSMLEMLVALAQHMDFQLFNLEDGDRTAKWFWVMVNNLGLELFDHANSVNAAKQRTNDVVIKKFVERTYAPSGKGGLFPLRRPQEDQRNVELWYQMMCYIGENYRM